MAEAFAHIHGEEKFNAYSAGSRPSGQLNPKAIEAMKMLGYDLSNHQSKSVDDFRDMSFEYVVTMGCGDECPFILSKYHEDWSIPDPGNLTIEEFISVREIIESKVKQLLDKIVND